MFSFALNFSCWMLVAILWACQRGGSFARLIFDPSLLKDSTSEHSVAGQRACVLSPSRRSDRGEEFISVIPLFRWRKVPCLRDAPRGSPPGDALVRAVTRPI